MFASLDDQLLGDAVSRAEHSRASYTAQAAEFRALNANFEAYLVDMQTIDEQNRQLQEKIEQIRKEYVLALETHLKRLPSDFREQSQTLTEAHLERYRSKSRAKRFLKERDELKRRINFVASDEKEQAKRLKALQKQERLVGNEFNKLNQHIQSLLTYVENEKRNYRVATEKVDHLQIQLERICVDRSQTEFEIQTLKEEVKLMQTTREFLDDERETLMATRAEANEDLLSRLGDSIDRIRSDFEQLNQAQLNQAENEYKQMLQLLEENLLAEQPPSDEPPVDEADSRRLHDEHRAALDELTALKESNRALAERTLMMEADLHSLRDERRQQQTSKDNELERSQLELQTLSEKLTHLAEYDRNLQFELKLYRGVLESEYRRKQSVIGTIPLTRPTTLRSSTNVLTDRTSWLTTTATHDILIGQPQEEASTSGNRTPASAEPLLQNTTVQSSGAASTTTASSDDDARSQASELAHQATQPDTLNATHTAQDNEVHTPSEQDPSTSESESPRTPSSTPLATSSLEPREEPLETSPLSQAIPSSSELQSPATSLPFVPTNDQQAPPAEPPASFDSQSSSFSVPQPQAHESQPSSRTASFSSPDFNGSQRRSSVVETPTNGEQPPAASDAHRRPSTSALSISGEQPLSSSRQDSQPTSRKSSMASATQSDHQGQAPAVDISTSSTDRPSSPSTIVSASALIDAQTIAHEQPSSRTSSVSSTPPSDAQAKTAEVTASETLESQAPAIDSSSTTVTDTERRSSESAAPTLAEHQPSSDAQRRPSTVSASNDLEEQSSSSASQEPSIDLTAVSDDQRRLSTAAIPPLEYASSSSRTSSLSSTVPTTSEQQPPTAQSDTPRRPSAASAPIDPEEQPSSIPSQEPRLSSAASSRTSSLSSTVPTTVLATDLEEQPSSTLSQEPQPSSRQPSVDLTGDQQRLSTAAIPPEEHPWSSSRTSSISSTAQTTAEQPPPATQPDASRRSPTASVSTDPEEQSSSSTSQEPQPSSRQPSVDLTAVSAGQHSPSSSRTSSLSSTVPNTAEQQPSTTQSDDQRRPSTTSASNDLEEQPSSTHSHEAQPSSRQPSVDLTAPSNDQQRPSTAAIPPYEYSSSSSRTSSMSSTVPADPQRRSSAVDAVSSPEQQSSTIQSDAQRRPSTVVDAPVSEDQTKPPSSNEDQPSSRAASVSSTEPSDTQSTTAVAGQPLSVPEYEYQSSPRASSASSVGSSDEARRLSTPNSEVLPQHQSSSAAVDHDPSAESTSTSQGQTSTEPGDDRASNETGAKTLPIADERPTDAVLRSAQLRSSPSFEHSSTEEYEVSIDTDLRGSRSSSFASPTTRAEEGKSDLSHSDQAPREEATSSSLDHPPSTKDTDDQSPALRSLPQHETSQHSTPRSSLTDVGGDAAALEKTDSRSEEYDDPNLVVIVQELRYVFHELANSADVVEIDQTLPDKLLERLEFRDQLIRTLFDTLLRKYLVQAVAQGNRPSTLDWTEFRDILFPMISGRYTERHIRKLFDLFDISGDGHLSVQEIAELLEVLQASDTIHLAQNIVDAYDTDHDGKLSADELIEAIKKTEDINEHVLSKDTENQQWFNQTSLEDQTITLEVPVVHFPKPTDPKLNEPISLLGRVFKTVGANPDSKQLDSTDGNLLLELTNAFIDNNINISNTDLQRFIQSFLDHKQRTDTFINWPEFRDTFLPIVNRGSYTLTDLKRWFDLLDADRNAALTREQVSHLLRLLQIRNSDVALIKLIESRGLRAGYWQTWTFDELTTAFGSIDETNAHLLKDHEHVDAFDTNWLAQNIF